jgi:shikimate dehydrogenase
MAQPGGDANPAGEPNPIKELPLSADEVDDRLIVVDLVYRQEFTPLMRAARARGLRCADGLDVLVHQGAASFRLWTGKSAPLGAMRSGATGED